MNTKKLLLLPMTALLMAACSDDDSLNTNNGNATAIENTAKAGTWRITSYIDSGDNQTGHFTGYNFTFANGGALTAANGTNTYTGAWSVTDSDNSDDDSSDDSDIDFNIAFSVPAAFADLTDDWDVAQYTTNKIVLEDVSGGNGGTDYLTFEKN